MTDCQWTKHPLFCCIIVVLTIMIDWLKCDYKRAKYLYFCASLVGALALVTQHRA